MEPISVPTEQQIIRVLKRLEGARQRLLTEPLDDHFWNTIINLPNVQLEFHSPISEAIVRELRQRAEYRMIARLLVIEPKDVPFLILAFRHQIPIVTVDEESLLSKQESIRQRIGVELILPEILV